VHSATHPPTRTHLTDEPASARLLQKDDVIAQIMSPAKSEKFAVFLKEGLQRHLCPQQICQGGLGQLAKEVVYSPHIEWVLRVARPQRIHQLPQHLFLCEPLLL